MGVGIGQGPVLSHPQHLARVARPDRQVAGHGEAMAVGHGPIEPGSADAEAIDAAVLEVGKHLGRRQGLQVHVAVGIDRVGR